MNNVEFMPAFAQKSVKRTANKPLCRCNMGPGESNQDEAPRKRKLLENDTHGKRAAVIRH
jgi:hypothetical protein